MATTTVDTEIIVRTEQLVAKLREIPGIADKEFDRMARAISKQYAKAAAEADRAAKKIADDTQKAAAKAQSEWERGLEAIGKKIASKFGPISADLADIGTSGAGALGAIGTGAAVGAAGVAALGLAVVGGVKATLSLIDAAEAARDRLEQVAGVDPLPAETIDALDEWRDSSRAAATATDVLTAKVGGIAASVWTPAANAVAGLADELGDLSPRIETVTSTVDTLQTGLRVMAEVVSLGGTELLRYAADLDSVSVSGAQMAESLRLAAETQALLDAHVPIAEKFAVIADQAAMAQTGASKAMVAALAATEAVDRATADYVTSLNTLNISEDERRIQSEAAARIAEVRKGQIIAEAEATDAAALASKAKAEADKASAEAARDAARAEQERSKALAATEQLQNQILQTTSDTIGAEGEIERAYDARVQAIDRASKAGADAAAVAEALDQAELRRQRDLVALHDERAAAIEAEAKQNQRLEADLVDLRGAVDDLGDSWIGTGSIVGQIAQVWAEQIQGLMDKMSPITDVFGQWSDAFSASNDQIIADMESRHGLQMEQFETERDQRQQAIDDWLTGEQQKIDARLADGAISKEQANLELKRLARETEQKRKEAAQQTADAKAELDRRHQDQLAEAKKAFKANQNLQRVQAAIESIRAGISLIPAYAYLGPFAPAAAAATAATSLGIALAAISAHKPPEFPIGRPPLSPDHQLVGVRPDEAILPGRTVSQLGGPRAVERLIDRGPHGSTINLHIDGRLVASHALDQMDGDARFQSSGWAAGKRPLYGL